MIKKLVEYVSKNTPFTILYDDQKENDAGYKVILLTQKMTIPSKEEMKPVIEYWQSLKTHNAVMFGENSIPMFFFEGDDRMILMDRLLAVWKRNPDLRFIDLIAKVSSVESDEEWITKLESHSS